MGPAGSTTFIVVSGLVTGWLYMKYKNVLALMTGHWAINIMISIVTSTTTLFIDYSNTRYLPR
jgi:membrane protease YdiL (CAAX protease family)